MTILCLSCLYYMLSPVNKSYGTSGVNEFGDGWTDEKYRYDFDTEVNGNMFEIEAVSNITITAFEIYTFRDEYQEDEKAQVWTKKGSYIGSEENEGLWTNVLGDTVAKFNMERTVLEFDYPMYMAPCENQAFYVAIEGKCKVLT